MASQHDSQPLFFEGFWQHGDLKIGQFRKWLDLCIIVAESDWGLYPIAIDNTDPSDNDIISDIDILGQDPEQVLPTGHYVILNRETLRHVVAIQTPLNYFRRTASHSGTSSYGRGSSFKNRVRERDGRCVITGNLVSDFSENVFRAVHIFPIAHLNIWRQSGFESLVTDTGLRTGDAKIDSVQNGMLLRPDVHDLFDRHLISINPDNGYMVTDFTKPGEFHGGRMYHAREDGDSERPLDELFRFHFLQAVLRNVRSIADDELEGPDSDSGEEVDWHDVHSVRLDNPKLHKTANGKARLETELASKLNLLAFHQGTI
ncbi:hypothetical protein FA10DRAFT_267217 [Acaromyces ingoldii]|uniref:HNH nuclease domain-containing protein n=1 Tax=Acaromyces ingoldii TaxID=215250 RepID=A0A316YND3_9BASI|nr:hypothetical protein FA10DRAFT_267217 [Acaromyces ingoldii]PWN90779.1 hypothetical protein FA10DRAFT_267217 [Acaromyces ingoldii]